MRTKLVVGILALILIGGAAYLLRDVWSIAEVKAWVVSLGVWGPLGFALIYVLATVMFVPGAALTLAGGALFGPWLGTLYSLTAATIGATLAFLLARYLAGDWVEHRAAGWVRRLKQGVEDEGWRFVVFVRLVPLFPFNLLNYALGLTRIPLGQYVIASWLAMFPGALAYTWLGHVGGETLAGQGTIRGALIALALLAVVGFLPRFLKRFRGGSPSVASEKDKQND